jgi:hypothetical protein
MWAATMGHAQDDGLGGWEEAEPAWQAKGEIVDLETQRALGLVTVDAGVTGEACTGILLNQYWVLTSQLCMSAHTTGAEVAVYAAWQGVYAMTTSFLAVGSSSSGLALVFLEAGDFGPVNALPLLDSTEASLRIYANWTPPFPEGGFSDGLVRTGLFYIPDVAQDAPYLETVDGRLVGFYDRGAPMIAEDNGVLLGIAGVQRGCNYFSGHYCSLARVEDYRDEILTMIVEVPSLVETATSPTYDGEPAVPAEPAPGTSWTGGSGGGPWVSRP